MKRSYLLLSGLVLSSSVLFAQSVNIEDLMHKGEIIDYNIEAPQKNSNTRLLDKAYMDTVYIETFDNSLNGWTVGNNTGDSKNWEWHNDEPGGEYTSGTAMIESTSGPGFLSLRMDYINTPTPVGGKAPFDAWVTSPKITIPAMNSVYIQFEQYFRYCCENTTTLTLEVSTDGVNFQAYDVTGGKGANTPTPNAELVQINVSDVLAGKTEAYIRFHVDKATTYFWMVDDVAIIEGPANAVELEHFLIGYHEDNYQYTPNYGMFPLEQTSGAFSVAYVRNVGYETTTNVEAIIEVSHDSTLSGGTGTGLVYTEDSLISAVLPTLGRDTGVAGLDNPFFAADTGYYSYRVTAVSDSVNEVPLNVQSQYHKFIVSDSTYALETNNFGGHGGPGNYVGAGADGDKFAQLFIVEQTTWASSITVAIPARADMHNIGIAPIIYKFDEDVFLNAAVRDLTALRAAITPVFQEIINPITVDTATMGGRWNTFMLSQRVKLEPGAYYVGIEQTSGQNTGKKIFLYRSLEAEERSNALSSIMDIQGGTNPGWGGSSHILGIRLNVGPETVGINEKTIESATEFSVSPNPTNGEFKVYLNSKEAVNYKLTINNMLGQEVYTDDISVNGSYVKDLSLEGLDKGVYFINLNNGNESLVKKIVLN